MFTPRKGYTNTLFFKANWNNFPLINRSTPDSDIDFIVFPLRIGQRPANKNGGCIAFPRGVNVYLLRKGDTATIYFAGLCPIRKGENDKVYILSWVEKSLNLQGSNVYIAVDGSKIKTC